MATLVFGAVGAGIGSLLGDPALGWSVGTLLGGALFPAKSTAQSRGKLDDLRVSGSAYGAMIPQIYGQGLVGGNIFWSTDLQQSSHTVSTGGKGGGGSSTKQYDYSASFAIGWCQALSQGVKRIWFDDIVVYDATKAANTQYQIRNYLGGPSQQPDSLMVAKVGAGKTPAYKDWTWSVCQDIPLANFGNRLPSPRAEIGCGIGSGAGAVVSAALPTGGLAFNFGPDSLFDVTGGASGTRNGGRVIGWTDSWHGHVVHPGAGMGPEFLYNYQSNHPVVYFQPGTTLTDPNAANWADLSSASDNRRPALTNPHLGPVHLFMSMMIDSWVSGSAMVSGVNGVQASMLGPVVFYVSGDNGTTQLTFTLPYSEWCVLEVNFNGPNSWISINGGSRYVGNAGSGGSSLSGWTFANAANAGSFMVQRAVGYSGTRSDADRNTIIGLLKTEAGIP